MVLKTSYVKIHRVNETAQWIKTLADKTDDLSSILRTHIGERK